MHAAKLIFLRIVLSFPWFALFNLRSFLISLMLFLWIAPSEETTITVRSHLLWYCSLHLMTRFLYFSTFWLYAISMVSSFVSFSISYGHVNSTIWMTWLFQAMMSGLSVFPSILIGWPSMFTPWSTVTFDAPYFILSSLHMTSCTMLCLFFFSLWFLAHPFNRWLIVSPFVFPQYGHFIVLPGICMFLVAHVAPLTNIFVLALIIQHAMLSLIFHFMRPMKLFAYGAFLMFLKLWPVAFLSISCFCFFSFVTLLMALGIVFVSVICSFSCVLSSLISITALLSISMICAFIFSAASLALMLRESVPFFFFWFGSSFQLRNCFVSCVTFPSPISLLPIFLWIRSLSVKCLINSLVFLFGELYMATKLLILMVSALCLSSLIENPPSLQSM